MLLEILDSFRQSIEPYDEKWRKEHLWLDLAHVCQKWRCIIFSSISRLDIGITVGPAKPGHIKTILSSSLPIFLDYSSTYDWEDWEGLTGSALWRIRAILKHHPDRVREITFQASMAAFNKFFKMTKCVFPMLESLSLDFYGPDMSIPATFLKGNDLSLPHLRRLTVRCNDFITVFGFLSSATVLTVTDLTLKIDSPFGTTPETSLLACLQVMPCLLSLDLTIVGVIVSNTEFEDRPIDLDTDTVSEYSIPQAEDPVLLKFPEEIFIHSNLKYFCFTGDSRIIKKFIRWFRTPSLKQFKCHNIIPTPEEFKEYSYSTSHVLN